MSEFDALWTELGLDLKAHQELIDSATRLHKKMFLSQENRPKAMRAFDHALHGSHSTRVKELWEYRKNGGKAIGTFCIFVPDEIALSANVIPIPLCGGSGWSVEYADKMLPRDICPLIRSTFGMALSKTCPYGKLKDFILGETTCDAKKKTWDLIGCKVLEVPQRKEPEDLDLWRGEVKRFTKMVEELGETELTLETLKEKTRLVNKKREILQQIDSFRTLPEPPITGLDALLVAQTALSMDVEKFIAAGEELIAELQDRVTAGASAYSKPGLRILVAGSPSPMGYAKIHWLIESMGMRVVVDESCTGARYSRTLVDTNTDSLDQLIENIADRYFGIDCACFSPNSERTDNVKEIINTFKIDAVVHSVLQYCHSYDIESRQLDKTLKELDVPSLRIVTDYSEEDVEQLRTRVEAFMEVTSS